MSNITYIDKFLFRKNILKNILFFRNVVLSQGLWWFVERKIAFY